MLIGIPRETVVGETRVSATPETVKKLAAQGHQVMVEVGAGIAASVTDSAYEAAGGEITDRVGALGRSSPEFPLPLNRKARWINDLAGSAGVDL